MKDESLRLLNNFIKDKQELKEYGEKIAKLCDYLPLSLTIAGFAVYTVKSL